MIEATPEQQAQMSSHARRFTTPALLDAIQAFNTAASDQRSAWQPALPLEMALAQLISERPSSGEAAARRAGEPATSTAPATERAEKPPKTASPKAQAAPEPVEQPAVQSASAEQPPVSEEASQAVSDAIPEQAENSAAVDLQTILNNWQKIRQRVKTQSSPVDGLLNSCKSITMRTGVLQLGFGSEVLKTMMEKGNNLKITRKAIREVLGVEVEIACIVVQGKGSQLQLDADIEADGMVSTAIRLGGKIVHKE
jgi:DNA polymerase-3 subunit gamma/tau